VKWVRLIFFGGLGIIYSCISVYALFNAEVPPPSNAFLWLLAGNMFLRMAINE